MPSTRDNGDVRLSKTPSWLESPLDHSKRRVSESSSGCVLVSPLLEAYLGRTVKKMNESRG